MARPKFFVQHFMACRNAPWEGVAGPLTLRTLEGVGYRYTVPPDTEFPTEHLADFWLYARLILTNAVEGNRRFSLDVIWRDADGVTDRERSVWTDPKPLGTVRFSAARPVVNIGWKASPLVIPGTGRYTFRLYCRFDGWNGPERRTVAEEYVLVERSQ